MEKERRLIPSSETRFEVRTSDDGEDYLSGMAIVFNKRSVNFGWGGREKIYEVIDPSACEGARMDEVICKFNHDINHTLGTVWGGTLTYSIDSDGVRYEVKLPKTETGRMVKELAARGDLRGNSFEFIASDYHWLDEKEDGEDVYIRKITKFEGIYDFAPVIRPAYPDTNGTVSLSKRVADSLEEFKTKATPKQDEVEPQETETETTTEPVNLRHESIKKIIGFRHKNKTINS